MRIGKLGVHLCPDKEEREDLGEWADGLKWRVHINLGKYGDANSGLHFAFSITRKARFAANLYAKNQRARWTTCKWKDRWLW